MCPGQHGQDHYRGHQQRSLQTRSIVSEGLRVAIDQHVLEVPGDPNLQVEGSYQVKVPGSRWDEKVGLIDDGRHDIGPRLITIGARSGMRAPEHPGTVPDWDGSQHRGRHPRRGPRPISLMSARRIHR